MEEGAVAEGAAEEVGGGRQLALFSLLSSSAGISWLLTWLL